MTLGMLGQLRFKHASRMKISSVCWSENNTLAMINLGNMLLAFGDLFSRSKCLCRFAVVHTDWIRSALSDCLTGAAFAMHVRGARTSSCWLYRDTPSQLVVSGEVQAAVFCD